MSDQHTPLPWYVYRSFIPGSDGHEYSDSIREVSTNNYVGGAKEHDAAFIVLACNSHDELVRLLTYAVTYSSAKGIFPEGFLEDAAAALQVSK